MASTPKMSKAGRRRFSDVGNATETNMVSGMSRSTTSRRRISEVVKSTLKPSNGEHLTSEQQAESEAVDRAVFWVERSRERYRIRRGGLGEVEMRRDVHLHLVRYKLLERYQKVLRPSVDNELLQG